MSASTVKRDTDSARPLLAAQGLSLYFGQQRVLYDIDLAIEAKQVTVLFGPPDCGKTRLLCCFNRMHDDVRDHRIVGSVELAGRDIYAADADITGVRRQVGMVFERARPFPWSVFDNVAYGPRIQGVRRPVELRRVVRWALNKTGMLKEFGGRLETPALTLSLAQQRRLLIARALALKPRVLMLDRPTAGLDPGATGGLERLIMELKSQYTIIVVTRNPRQVARIADDAAFMDDGEIIESGAGAGLVSNPVRRRTADFMEGRYG